MPLSKGDIPAGLTAGVKGLFYESVTTMTPQWGQVAMLVNSDKDTETYGWLEDVPAMRQFLGDRLIKSLSERKYTLVNKTWESTIGIDREAIEDEQYGQIPARVRMLAYEAIRYQDELVYGLLESGSTGLAADGNAFFSDSHTSGDNYGAAALSAASVQTAIAAMRRFKGSDSQPLNIVPDTLVVPPDLEWTAYEITQSNVVRVNTTTATYLTNYDNVLRGRLKVVVTPYITTTTKWCLLDTSKPVKPLIFQQRVAPELEALEGSSDSGFMRDQWLYGVRARYNAGFGLWQLAYCSTGTS